MKHTLSLAALLTFGLTAAPQIVYAQTTDQSATAAPDANATVNPMASSGPIETPTTGPDTGTATATTSTTSGPWGLLGLLGLLGLIGLRGRSTVSTTRL